ncbi:MAG: hypothetical protein ABJD11_08565 [Gemmatimonadota bacterium]
MKLVDTEETIVIVTGSDLRAEERDRPLAYKLKEEVDRRSDGQSFRRAVVVGDVWFLENRIFHMNPTVAVGGPGVNGVCQQLTAVLPTLWTESERSFVQADFEGELKRAALWGMDMATTSMAVDAFVSRGFLDDLLRRIWRFRTGVMV